MKKSKIIIILILICGVSSCDVTDLDDIGLQNQIESEDAFNEESKIEAAYAGMYNDALFNSTNTIYTAFYKAQTGILLQAGLFGGNIFLNNSYDEENMSSSLYSAGYITINTINYFIDGIENTSVEMDATRKTEMLAEARFLRAYTYMYLLNSFGEHWDLNSVYGVVLKTLPSTELVIDPRSTVQETYDLIFSDLDDAIANAPDFSTAIYVSKEAAKAFKGKALMYAGMYAQAIPLLEDVITGGFSLEPNYADVFEKTFESSEAILVNYWDEENNGGVKNIIFDLASTVTPYYTGLLTGDPRYDGSFKPNQFFWLPPVLKKWPTGVAASNATISMRLAEVYLMHAECVIRSGGSLVTAQASVDAVRDRVGLPTTGAVDAAELLEHIRIEKIKELGAETGVNFEDITRYHYAGDIDGLSLKPTLSSEHLLIWPISFLTIEVTEGVVIQNPGY